MALHQEQLGSREWMGPHIQGVPEGQGLARTILEELGIFSLKK